jgi:hypothetical protein
MQQESVDSSCCMLFAGSLPGTIVAHKLMQAIKSKCSPSEAEEILRELPNPLHSSAGLWLLVLNQEALLMAS